MNIELAKAVKGELSGSKAKSYVAGLTEFHRIQGSPMMRDAAEYVRTRLKRMGADDVRLEEFTADGRRKYWTYTSTLGWHVRSAELRLVEPSERVLARFVETPQSLHTFSRGTPVEGVVAELVDVGKGASAKDYVGRKVKGRLVLATGKARDVQREAVVKRGAVGVITDSMSYEFSGVRESSDVPDAHSYQGIWPNAKDSRKIRFGFSLSKRQGEELRKYLRDGKTVRLRAKVNAGLSSGKYSIVTGAIRGATRPDEEIFLVAHLCHPKPSANDNASGSGLLMEIARTVTTLIESGKIERPERTIRFLWVPETIGTVAYLSRHTKMHSRLIAGINLDMVGEDQMRCRSTLCLDCTPDSLPSYLNDFVYSVIQRSNVEYDSMTKIGIPSNFRTTMTSFSGGSDHTEFNESTVGAPCVGLTQWPDLYYHTSMDTIDNVSEDSLRRVGWAVAVSALTLANADAGTVHEMASKASSEGMKRITDAVEKASAELLGCASDTEELRRIGELVRHHHRRVEHVVHIGARAVRSVCRLDPVSGTDAFVEGQAIALEEHGSRELTRLDQAVEAVAGRRSAEILARSRLTRPEARAKTVVPRRKFKGTLDPDTLSERLGEQKYDWYSEAESKDNSFSKKMYEVVNLIDGKRNVYDITVFVSAEYGPTDTKDVLRFLDDLKITRLVAY